MDKLKGAASFLKNKLQPDEIDQKLTEAVSEQNWQASTQLLHQIANASYNYQKQAKVIDFVWNKLKHKNWKKVLKTLHLIDFLIKYGPTTVIDNFKENVYDFRKLDDYSAKVGGVDQGESIRKQAKVIVTLLTDDTLLNDQRAKAKQIKDRMSTVIGSGAYFGGFSSNSQTNNETGNYGAIGNGGSKASNYGNINSEAYKYTPSSNSTGMSFGESVMRQLQQKKRGTQPQYQAEPQKMPPSKLNLSNMIQKKSEKKVEPEKKSFNSLSMKLVKPPEKKTPVGPNAKKSQVSTKPVSLPSSNGQKGNVNILDLDFNSMSLNESTPTATADPIDILGDSSAQSNSQPQNNSFNLFEQPAVSQPVISNPPQIFTPQNNLSQPYQNFSLQPGVVDKPQPQPTNLNYQQSYSPPSGQGYNFLGAQKGANMSVGAKSNVKSEPVGISLSLGSESRGQKKDETNLVDFSNFRDEIGSIKPGQRKQAIQSNWNW